MSDAVMAGDGGQLGLRVPVLRCLTAAVLFAASAPAASRLADTVPSVTLAGLLYLGAGLGVAPFVLRRRRPDRVRLAADIAAGGGGSGALAGAGAGDGAAGGVGSAAPARAGGGSGVDVGAGAGAGAGAGLGPGAGRDASDVGGGVRADRAGWAGRLVGSEAVALGVAVLAGGALGPVLLVAGLARTSAATASILLNLELAATVLFARVLFREHVGRVLAVAAGLITASGAVLAWSPGASIDGGALLVGGACLCWGLDNVVTARIEGLTPSQVVLAKGLVAGGANVTLGMVLYGSGDGGGLPGWGAALAAVAIGTAGYGWSITLWVKGARDLGAARAQVCFSTAPFIGAALAWVAFGEGPSVAQGAAMAVAAVGVGLSLASAHAHPHLHPALLHAHEHRHPDAHHDHLTHHHGAATGPGRRHTHQHGHPEQAHDAPHVPDVHHRHVHDERTDADGA